MSHVFFDMMLTNANDNNSKQGEKIPWQKGFDHLDHGVLKLKSFIMNTKTFTLSGTLLVDVPMTLTISCRFKLTTPENW
jgi:hypothetical protein